MPSVVLGFFENKYLRRIFAIPRSSLEEFIRDGRRCLIVFHRLLLSTARGLSLAPDVTLSI